MKFTISTEYGGEHKDFQNDEMDSLESYLDGIGSEYRDEFYPWDSLFSATKNALKRRASEIVEPASEDTDITISITYH